MSRPTGKTSACSRTDARARLEDARAFLTVADLALAQNVITGDDDINLSGVSVALAVLVGIAAADAVCCHRLGRRFRGQDHRGAVDVVKTLVPEGPDMAKELGRLLDVKDSAHYGVLGVSAKEARKAVEQARRMVDRATTALLT